MNKETLINSANELKKVSHKSYNDYNSKSDDLVATINEIFLKRKDLEKLIGVGNLDMMKDNHANHVKFISSILKNLNPEVLTETVLWVFRAYISHGFSENYWPAQLNIWTDILKSKLSDESYKEIYPYYEWMIINIPIFVKLSNENLSGFKPRH